MKPKKLMRNTHQKDRHGECKDDGSEQRRNTALLKEGRQHAAQKDIEEQGWMAPAKGVERRQRQTSQLNRGEPCERDHGNKGQDPQAPFLADPHEDRKHQVERKFRRDGPKNPITLEKREMPQERGDPRSEEQIFGARITCGLVDKYRRQNQKIEGRDPEEPSYAVGADRLASQQDPREEKTAENEKEINADVADALDLKPIRGGNAAVGCVAEEDDQDRETVYTIERCQSVHVVAGRLEHAPPPSSATL